MKRNMNYFVAIAAVLWMAIPQLKAQTVEKDHDPGIMYLFSNEGKNIAFEEGNEWEILFTNTDTLGNEYASPVGMTLKGGVHGDSSYIYLQTVDSILMYQPEPQMQKGVFVITRDYFPYIAAVDSFTTIHFDNSLPYALPEVGQKVVCNVYEEPLRNGFIGTVLKKDSKDGQLVMECDPYIDDIKDFYSYFLYAGSGGYTEEEQQAVERISKANRVRRGVVAQAKTRAGGNEGEALIDPKLSYEFGFSGNPLDVGGISIGGTYNIKGNVGVTVTLFPTEIGIQLPGLKANFDASTTGSIKVEGQGSPRPIPIFKYGKTKRFTGPLNTVGTAGVGFFIQLEGKASFSVMTEPNMRSGSFDLKWDGKENTYVTDASYNSTGKELQWSGWEGTVSGFADLRVGASLKAEALGGKVELETGLYLSGMKVEGQLSEKVMNNPKADKPDDLFENYKDFVKGNRLTESAALRFDSKFKVNALDVIGIGADKSQAFTFYEVDYPALPSSTSEWEVIKPNNRSELKVRVVNDGHSVVPCMVELWIYNEDLKKWAKQLPLGEIGSLEDSDFDFTKSTTLDQGYTYTACTVYSTKFSNVYFSQAFMTNAGVLQEEKFVPIYIVKDLFIPYEVEMKRPVLDNFNTLKLEAEFLDLAAIEEEEAETDEKKEISYGFCVQIKGQKAVDIPADMVVDGKFEAEIEVPSRDFNVVAYVDVKGKKRSSSEVHIFKGVDLFTPILQEPTDIEFDKATFTMKLSFLYKDEPFVGAFEYWEPGKKAETLKTIPVDGDDLKDGVITKVATDLYPNTTYHVRAVTEYGTLEYASQQTEEFTTAAPIKDTRAIPSYKSVVLETSVADNYGIDATIFFRIDKNKNMSNPDEYKMTDWKFVERDMIASVEIESLEPNTEYTYQVHMETELGEAYDGPKKTFKTLDGNAVEVNTPAVKSTSAILKGTVTSYVLDNIKEGDTYTVRFYYGKSKSGVKNRQSDYVDVTVAKAQVEGAIEGLERGGKYYYMLVLNNYEGVKSKSEVKSFVTPNPYEVSTLDAEVEDATVTLKGMMTLEAYDELMSGAYNTIFVGFDYSTSREALSKNTVGQVVRLLEVGTKKGAGNATFETTLDLEPGTIYYYRSFIYFDDEEYTAGIKTFETLEYDGGLIPWAKKKKRKAAASTINADNAINVNNE